MQYISELPVANFLSQRANHKDLVSNQWPFEEYAPHCVAAVQAEPKISSLVNKCVPKKCDEAEFWRCYFANLYSRSRVLFATNILTREILMKEDDATSNAVISIFETQRDFQALSQAEAAGIRRRDEEDDEKLATGIKFAVAKKVIPASVQVEGTKKIDVKGRTAEEVAKEIVQAIGSAKDTGCIVVLQGLSGTGKGTTVSKLQQKLPKSKSWSNGNLFRALTLLAVTHCEQKRTPLTPDVLTPALLAELMQMLTFALVNGEYDIKVEGLGLSCIVSGICNTKLKDPRVSQHIPMVAQFTQGEVINFAANACAEMSRNGYTVLMEGREQTLNYVRSPHRFELTMQDFIAIGMRRAAQRMIAQVVQKYKAQPSVCASPAQMVEDLEVALAGFMGSS